MLDGAVGPRGTRPVAKTITGRRRGLSLLFFYFDKYGAMMVVPPRTRWHGFAWRFGRQRAFRGYRADLTVLDMMSLGAIGGWGVGQEGICADDGGGPSHGGGGERDAPAYVGRQLQPIPLCLAGYRADKSARTETLRNAGMIAGRMGDGCDGLLALVCWRKDARAFVALQPGLDRRICGMHGRGSFVPSRRCVCMAAWVGG